MKDNVLLCGLPGVGKTTVGNALAFATNRPFIDADILVEEFHGLSCSELYLLEGEEKFRIYEQRILKNLQHTHGQVIALGGGVVESEENCRLLQKLGIVIHLKCDVNILLTRKKPSFIKNESEFLSLAERRIPLYDQIQTFSIDVSRLSPEKIVESIRMKLYGQQ